MSSTARSTSGASPLTIRATLPGMLERDHGDIVNVPVNGTDEATVRANAWMFQQVLATGVHGVLLCHADTPGAVPALITMALAVGCRS